MKLKKRENVFESNLTEMEKLRIIISDLERDKKTSEGNYHSEIQKYIEEIRELKKGMLKLRQ